jgi:hypothetical protein
MNPCRAWPEMTDRPEFLKALALLAKCYPYAPKAGFVPAQEWSRSHPHGDVTPGALSLPGQRH